ncbi:MAG TPA: hypothetical protein VGL72_09560 [Bryobacteraceae bacterium]|jgi:hypothetical protein
MKTAVILFAVIALSPILYAQQPLKALDPPELVEAKADHVRAMNRVQIAPLTAYLQSLTSLRQLYVREAKTDAVASVDAAIKSARAELDAATAGSNMTVAAATQLQIDQAVYGDLQRNRVADVTNYIKDALATGQPTVSIWGHQMLGATDPAPGTAKSVRVTYAVDGKRKFKDFKEGPDAILNFKKDLR